MVPDFPGKSRPPVRKPDIKINKISPGKLGWVSSHLSLRAGVEMRLDNAHECSALCLNVALNKCQLLTIF